MTKFSYSSIEIDGHKHYLTFAKTEENELRGVVGVTDAENGIHYESSLANELDGATPTATIPDEVEEPERIERNVSVSTMEDIFGYVIEGESKKLQRSLAGLGEEILGHDSRRDRPRDPDSRKAEERQRILNAQGEDPDRLDENDYPTSAENLGQGRYI